MCYIYCSLFYGGGIVGVLETEEESALQQEVLNSKCMYKYVVF